MKQITLGSLFDGVAGFPLAGSRNGITPKWASEIEPFPIAVTKARFPDMKHVGSVTEINVPQFLNAEEPIAVTR